MTVTELLAQLALDAASAEAPADLRPALLTDLAATVGHLGSLAPRLASVVTGPSPQERAFRLAARMHARTQDDFYPAGKVHVGATVLPAALAVEAADVVPAAAAGFAVLKVLAHTYRPVAQARGYRPTSLFAPMGAAAAAGVGLGLAPDALADALAIASACSGGTNQSWIAGTDEWLVEVATAARAGVEAALLADAGVRGAREAVEGRAGWAHAFFDDGGAGRLRKILDGPAEVVGPVAVKPFPVSGIAQVPSAAAAALGRGRGDLPVRRLAVRVARSDVGYPGSTNVGPFRSRSDSLMSIVRCAALAYLHGAIAVDQLDRTPDSAEQAVLDALEVVPDDEMAEEEAEVTVETDAGTATVTLTGRQVLYPTFDELVGDLPTLAKRSEALVATVEELAAAMQEDRTSAASLLRVLAEVGS